MAPHQSELVHDLLDLAGGAASGHRAIMMLASDQLRVVPVTVHLSLRRAIETLPEEARTSADAAMTALIEGVEMTERGMLATLERHGVRKIEAEGQKFDPNFHQAMFEVPNPNVANNTVVQVVQAGYAIGERVLRPAMVGVAKGGPKTEAASEDAAKA